MLGKHTKVTNTDDLSDTTMFHRSKEHPEICPLVVNTPDLFLDRKSIGAHTLFNGIVLHKGIHNFLHMEIMPRSPVTLKTV